MRRGSPKGVEKEVLGHFSRGGIYQQDELEGKNSTFEVVNT
jgi:hypothetical protein